MIYFDNNYTMRKIKLTLIKSQIEVVGNFKFIVKDKATVGSGLPGQSGYSCILYLESECKRYAGMLSTSTPKYKKAKRGEYFGDCIVIQNIKTGEIYIVDKEYPDEAIKSITRNSKLKLGVILAVSTIFILSVIKFINTLLN